jgi:hypothetical protein
MLKTHGPVDIREELSPNVRKSDKREPVPPLVITRLGIILTFGESSSIMWNETRI